MTVSDKHSRLNNAGFISLVKSFTIQTPAFIQHITANSPLLTLRAFRKTFFVVVLQKGVTYCCFTTCSLAFKASDRYKSTLALLSTTFKIMVKRLSVFSHFDANKNKKGAPSLCLLDVLPIT